MFLALYLGISIRARFKDNRRHCQLLLAETVGQGSLDSIRKSQLLEILHVRRGEILSRFASSRSVIRVGRFCFRLWFLVGFGAIADIREDSDLIDVDCLACMYDGVVSVSRGFHSLFTVLRRVTAGL